MTRKVQPVILCGGSGTRLFPISRAQWPKQFLAIHSDHSLLQSTALRVAPGSPISGLTFLAPIIVGNADHRFAIADHLRQIGITPAGLLLEPVARNTAGAIAAAAIYSADLHPDDETLLLVLPSDHLISDVAAFHDVIARAAVAVAGKPLLATFGVRPSTPETGFGYIEVAGQSGAVPAVVDVISFREKPDRETADSYVQSGRYLWNSGMFLFSAGTILAELDRFEPAISRAARESVVRAGRDFDFIRLDAEGFAAMPSISIDYAVMEKTSCAVVAPCDIGWNDVGSFRAVWETVDKDPAGNAVIGDVWAMDTKNSLIHADGGAMIAAIGIEDLAVIATDDVVLVTARDRAEDVKLLVADLNARGRDEPKSRRKVFRPWGSYEQLSKGETYQVKRIILNPAAGISLQKHFRRSEHWVIVEGRALAHLDGTERELGPNESIYIPMGSVHRLTNIGEGPLILIEVQTGAYLGEDDIVRLEDAYNRDNWDRKQSLPGGN